MKHEETQSRIIAFLEGELPPEEEKRLTDEMAKDPELEREVREFKDILGDARSLDFDTPPGYLDHLYTRVKQRTHAQAEASLFQRIGQKLLAAGSVYAVAAVFLVLIASSAVLVFLNNGTETEDGVMAQTEWVTEDDSLLGATVDLAFLTEEQTENLADTLLGNMGDDLSDTALEQAPVLVNGSLFDVSSGSSVWELDTDQSAALMEILDREMSGMQTEEEV